MGATSLFACVACEAGKYSEVVGAWSIQTCVPCEAGKYLENNGSDAETNCMFCAAGKYSTITAATSTSTCLTVREESTQQHKIFLQIRIARIVQQANTQLLLELQLVLCAKIVELGHFA